MNRLTDGNTSKVGALFSRRFCRQKNAFGLQQGFFYRTILDLPYPLISQSIYRTSFCVFNCSTISSTGRSPHTSAFMTNIPSGSPLDNSSFRRAIPPAVPAINYSPFQCQIPPWRIEAAELIRSKNVTVLVLVPSISILIFRSSIVSKKRSPSALDPFTNKWIWRSKSAVEQMSSRDSSNWFPSMAIPVKYSIQMGELPSQDQCTTKWLQIL